jgi:predicted TIM-barrel fold metal-dependent hydrolase
LLAWDAGEKRLNFHNRSVIDAHVHVHPAMTKVMAEIMEANNLSSVVNLGILEVLGIPFQEGMRAFREALGDRLVYFTTPDFSDTSAGFGERMAEELERKVEAGANGLKIFKELGLRHRDADGNLIPVDDQRLDPVWAKAGELGVPVLIHTADPLAFFQPLDENAASLTENERWEELQAHPDWHFGTPEFLDHDTLLAQRNRVIERHHGTTFIGAHLGNYPENLAYVDACLGLYPNFYVDTSARIGEIGRHPAEEVRAFFLKHQDRVIFGTDLVIGWDALDDRARQDMSEFNHFYDAHWRFFEMGARRIDHPFPIQGAWKVDAISLPDDVLEKLYVRNAQRLIPGLQE